MSLQTRIKKLIFSNHFLPDIFIKYLIIIKLSIE
mgnify:CR=1 FL=1